MANRNFNRKQALEKEVKEIYLKAAIGASGAPTIDLLASKGVASISRASAGLYNVTLQDNYNQLLHTAVDLMSPVAEDIQAQVVSEAVNSTKVVQIRCVTAGVATDPASGDTLKVIFQLKNSSVP